MDGLVENKQLFNEILLKFKHISNVSIYRTQLKIAVDKYCESLNEISGFGASILLNYGKESFAIKKGNTYIPNDVLIQQCFKDAEKGKYRTFAFTYFEATLYELEKQLSQRK
jgi:hypothetical protein